jgi:hypothetical protein
MSNKFNALILLFLILFTSCHKDETVKQSKGQYAVSITYHNKLSQELYFFVDGENVGTLTPAPYAKPSFVSNCGDLRNQDNLTNVFVVKGMDAGEHILEIKNKEGTLIETLSFDMLASGCVFQDVAIANSASRM